MKNFQTNMLSNAALFGLYLALSSFILMLLYWVLNINMFSIGMSMLNLFITLGLVILFFWLSNKTLRDKYLDGSLTYGQGFINSLITGIVSGIISLILTYIFYKFIAPDYLAKIGEKTLEMLQNNPNIPENTMKEVEAKMAAMTPESTVIKAIPYSLGSSIVLSLIVSAFTKKKPDIFAAENSTEEEN
ncbi:MAG: DUF4199 domain-containing protein [Bacteroidetes bacterium]|nr:DUF4199 domain-containing protein [Bacteroidota bacterium]